MKLRHHLAALLILSAVQTFTSAARACFGACRWATWGERLDVCAAPSEGLLQDQLACMASNCSAECATYLDGYDACAAGTDLSCMPPGTEACGACMASAPPYELVGCKSVNDPCSADQTGCIGCNAWLQGGAPNNVCDAAYPVAGPVQSCACAGPCSAACGSSCAEGYLEIRQCSAETLSCGACLGASCTAAVLACQAS